MAPRKQSTNPSETEIVAFASRDALVLEPVFDRVANTSSSTEHHESNNDGCDCNCHCYCADDLVTLSAGFAAGALASVPKTVVIR